MIFVPPILLLVFGCGFLAFWRITRSPHHVALFGAGFLLSGLGLGVQVALWPAELGVNAVVSAMLYISGAISLSEGLLRRSGLKMPAWYNAVVFVAIVGGIAYYYYVDRDVVARIYIINGGFGAIVATAALRLWKLSRGDLIDRAVFWSALALGLHFIPRSWITIDALVDDLDTFATSPFWLGLQFTVSIAGAAMALTLLAAVTLDTLARLRTERDADPLSGLLNRRAFEEHARTLLQDRRARPLTIVACDIDNFKRINDVHGHAAGDEVISAFSDILRKESRAGDLVARIGGEEFVLLLGSTPRKEAFLIAERLRRRLQEAAFWDVKQPERITASFGVAEHRPGEEIWIAVDRADQMLYAAKRAGRNRTVAEGLQFPSAA
ncbi:sensor domain-containing diguanylate cyclase [Arvimicrobium flavum]|uniref:GGDEF domain-containing protein n=1 Tax=Arvimicrobium flavum TaxID=3393320 RepID=UPI00237BCFCD|nr:GGDEF domain-containing protein [Mesorhizobium shangrilense]